jgi:surface polysaccharide O-acyltransferase-like enzyme
MSVLVMTCHLQPLFEPDNLLDWLLSNGLIRLTMPCFLMINGYFIYSKIDDPKAVYKYVKHAVILYLVWSLIYMPHFYNFPLKRLLIAIFSGYYHLWYIPALFIGVLLFFAAKRFIKRDSVLMALFLVLYFCGYILQFIVADFPVSTACKLAIFRNGLFYGVPFLFLGYYVHKYETRLLKIRYIHIYFAAFIGAVLVFYESYLSFFDRQIHDMLIVAPVLCPVILIIILKHSKFTESDSYIGDLASGVYFTHVIAITLIMSVFGALKEYKIVYLAPVFFISLLLSVMVIKLNKRIKIFLERKTAVFLLHL